MKTALLWYMRAASTACLGLFAWMGCTSPWSAQVFFLFAAAGVLVPWTTAEATREDWM